MAKQNELNLDINDNERAKTKKLETRDDLRMLIEIKNKAILYQLSYNIFRCIGIFVLLASVGFMSNILAIIYIGVALTGFFKMGTKFLMVISVLAIIF